MIADDPFTHEEFRDRLGKLLRLLSSDQEAEAEAARRKLVQHLAHHGVSLADLAAHLGEVHESVPAASATALRQAAARAQRAEADHRAAEDMNERLLESVEALRGRLHTAWTVAAVAAGTGVVALLLVVGVPWWQARQGTPAVQQIAPKVSDAVAGRPPAPPSTDGGAGARQPSEWIGTVQQPAELLDDPDSAAGRRALLAAGARVLVLQSGPVWLRVRTERGDGFVLKGLVRADR